MTDQLLAETWTRDLEVLRAVAARIDATPGAYINAADLATETGLSSDECQRAAVALNGPYITAEPHVAFGGVLVRVSVRGITERGRRAAGLWPTGNEQVALVAALTQAAEATHDPAEAGALRRAASAVAGVGREALVDVLAAVINRQIGVG